MASLAKLLITPTFGTLALYPKDSIMSLAIVTAADSGFFGYLFGMLRSVRDKPQGASAALCVLDDGFSESQRDALFIQGASVRRLEWPYLRSLTTDARICLSKCQSPEYFPGYDTYMWIDADAWVQSWDAIDAYCAGAEECGFCIAPEWHPSYSLTHFWGIEFAKGWFGPPAPGTRDIPINAGVFAGRADAPHSKAWRKRIADVVERPPFNPIAHFALPTHTLSYTQFATPAVLWIFFVAAVKTCKAMPAPLFQCVTQMVFHIGAIAARFLRGGAPCVRVR
jgi:hypothetical protein